MRKSDHADWGRPLVFPTSSSNSRQKVILAEGFSIPEYQQNSILYNHTVKIFNSKYRKNTVAMQIIIQMNNIEVTKTYHAVLELYEVAEELDLCILIGVQEPEAALVRGVFAREPRGLQAT
jgi:hypothetical protein